MEMLYSSLVKGIFRKWYGEPPDLSEAGQQKGLVLVADGVGGLDLCGTSLRYVMGSMAVPLSVRVMKWGHGLGRWHADLTNESNRDLKAAEIAAEVNAFRKIAPDAPVYLVGKSGGTGLVVKALEQLPENAVEAVVLLSPAISPQYNLLKALQAVHREIVVFWSPLDFFVLGFGTRIFGTIDRIKSVSAGLVGFRPLDSTDEVERQHYAKLRQVRWQPGMASTGYLGGHVGPDNPAFLRKYVVPLLRVAEAPKLDSSSGSSRSGLAPIT